MNQIFLLCKQNIRIAPNQKGAPNGNGCFFHIELQANANMKEIVDASPFDLKEWKGHPNGMVGLLQRD